MSTRTDSPDHPGVVFDLMRHGEPEGGKRYRGTLDDPLSGPGWRQMQAAVGEHEQWNAVLTSPMTRCHAFAQHLARERGLALHVEPQLSEVSFGEWEGLTAAEIRQRTPGVLEAFWNNPVEHPPPGGEPLPDFHRRVTEALHHWRETLEGDRVLVVCHGGVIRMALAEVLATPPEKAMGALMVPYACRTRIRMDRMGERWLSCLVAHGQLSSF